MPHEILCRAIASNAGHSVKSYKLLREWKALIDDPSIFIIMEYRIKMEIVKNSELLSSFP